MFFFQDCERFGNLLVPFKVYIYIDYVIRTNKVYLTDCSYHILIVESETCVFNTVLGITTTTAM